MPQPPATHAPSDEVSRACHKLLRQDVAQVGDSQHGVGATNVNLAGGEAQPTDTPRPSGGAAPHAQAAFVPIWVDLEATIGGLQRHEKPVQRRAINGIVRSLRATDAQRQHRGVRGRGMAKLHVRVNTSASAMKRACGLHGEQTCCGPPPKPPVLFWQRVSVSVEQQGRDTQASWQARRRKYSPMIRGAWLAGNASSKSKLCTIQ